MSQVEAATPLSTNMNPAEVEAEELINLIEANIIIAKFILGGQYLCKDLGPKDPNQHKRSHRRLLSLGSVSTTSLIY